MDLLITDTCRYIYGQIQTLSTFIPCSYMNMNETITIIPSKVCVSACTILNIACNSLEKALIHTIYSSMNQPSPLNCSNVGMTHEQYGISPMPCTNIDINRVTSTSDAAVLSTLISDAGSWDQPWASSQNIYTQHVTHDMTRITATTSNGAMILDGMNTISNGTWYINTTSTTTFPITVISASQVRNRTYIITLIRDVDIGLTSLSTSAGAVHTYDNKGFSPLITNYIQDVMTSDVTIYTSSNDVVMIDGMIVSSAHTITMLTDGMGNRLPTSILITTSTLTYNLTLIPITKSSSSNSLLSTLTTSVGTLLPPFSRLNKIYGMTVSYDTTYIQVTAIADQIGATITINNIPLTTSTSTAIRLLISSNNMIAVRVTAADGISTSTYLIKVNREGPPPTATCQLYTGSICAGIINNTRIYLPAGVSQAEIEDKLVSLPTLITTLSPACGLALARVVCATAYMPCDETAFSNLIGQLIPPTSTQAYPNKPLPRFPNRFMCTAYEQACPATSNLMNNTNIRPLDPTKFTVSGAIGPYPDPNNLLSGRGFYPNIDADMIKIRAMLGDRTPNCNATGVAPGGQLTYPAGPTIYATLRVADKIEYLKVDSNTGYLSESNTNIPIRQPRCEPFDSNKIRATYQPRWLAGTRMVEPKIDLPRSFCERVIEEGTSIYIPAGYSQSALNYQAGQVFWLFGLMPYGECSMAFAKYVCSRAFMPCNANTPVPLSRSKNVSEADVVINLTVPLPSFPCRSVCTNFAEKCAAFLSTAPQLAPDCESRTLAPYPAHDAMGRILPGVSAAPPLLNDDFPLAYTVFGQFQIPYTYATIDFAYSKFAVTGTLLTTCNAMTSNTIISAAAVPYVCPYPSLDPLQADSYGRKTSQLELTSNERIQDGSCALPCQSLLWSQTEYDRGLVFAKVVAAFGWVCSLYIFLTWAVFASKRRQIYILGFTFSSFIMSTVIIVNLGQGIDKITCQSATQVTTQSNSHGSWCTLQGIILHYFSFASILMWLLQCWDLYLKIVRNVNLKGSKAEMMKRFYLGFSWGYPLLLVAIAAGKENYKQATGLPWCFLQGGYEFSLYYYQIIVCIVLGLIFMFSTLYTLYQVQRKTNASASSWKRHIRPIGFIILVCMIFSFILAYRFTMERYQSRYTDIIRDWVSCYLFTQPAQIYLLGNTGYQCPERPENLNAPFGLWHLIVFAVCGQGMIIFILYGTMKDNIYLWLGLFGCRAHTGKTEFTSKNTSQGSQGESKRDGSTTRGGTSRSGMSPAQRTKKTPGLVPSTPLNPMVLSPTTINRSIQLTDLQLSNEVHRIPEQNPTAAQVDTTTITPDETPSQSRNNNNEEVQLDVIVPVTHPLVTLEHASSAQSLHLDVPEQQQQPLPNQMSVSPTNNSRDSVG